MVNLINYKMINSLLKTLYHVQARSNDNLINYKIINSLLKTPYHVQARANDYLRI